MRSVFLLVLVAGCSSSYSASSSPDASAWSSASDLGASAQCFGANDCPPGDECNSFGYCSPIPTTQPDFGIASTQPVAPETVLRVEPPASGKRYVYIAIPDQDAVAKIDSLGLDVSLITVGADPGALATVPGEDIAVVLDRAASAASVLRAQPDGSDVVTTLPTAPTLNRLAMSPDGHEAIAFFDVRLSGGNLSPHQTFQDVTLIKLGQNGAPDVSIGVSVGFIPSEVSFSSDGAKAFVVTQSGVSVLDFASITKPAIAPTVAVLRDPHVESTPDQVIVSSDGKYALARVPSLAALRVVDLAGGAITDVALPSEPSDVEVTGDGTMALAVLRDKMQIALVPLPGALTDGTQVTLLATGSVVVGQAVITTDGKRALGFTNAVDEKAILVIDLAARTASELSLSKAVRNVLLSPDGENALVVHSKAPGVASASDPLDQYLDKHQAYSLVQIKSGYVKLELVDAAPGPIAFAPDSTSAYLLLGDESTSPPVRAVEAIDLGSFLVTDVKLGSPPISLGVVPASHQLYIAEDHPLGRMTFVDITTFKTRTLTGYALNSQIIE